MAIGATRNEGLGMGRWRWAIWGVAACLLMVPLIAMRFTSEVNWDASDFVFMGVMLFAACGTFELAARATRDTAYRTAVGITVVGSFLLIWINLAVGIIGSEDNVLNLMYAGILTIIVGGGIVARFAPGGMARAMVAAAVAQSVVGAVALSTGHFTLVIEAFFAALWLIAAALFRKAARERTVA